MRMKHVTLARNLPSIRRDGLLVRYAVGLRQAVWFVRPSAVKWALGHVADRKRCTVEDLCCIDVDIPAGELRKHGSGIYYVPADVPAARLGRATTFRIVEEECADDTGPTSANGMGLQRNAVRRGH